MRDDLYANTLSCNPKLLRDHYHGENLEKIQIDADNSDRQLTELFEDIQHNGISTNPTAIIQNDGSIVLEDGHKRTQIALSLELDSIDIDILGRMPEWRELVNNLHTLSKGKKWLYQPIDHPEFEGWSVEQGSERIEMSDHRIGELKEKRVLDVGACLGHMSRWAYKKGAAVDGIEKHPLFYKAAKQLNIMEGTEVRYHKSDLVKWLRDNRSAEFDLVTCLSVIHNVAQAGRKTEALWALYELSTRAPRMLFDIGEEREGAAVTQLGWNLTKDNLPHFLKNNTCYTKFELLGTQKTYCKRDLYLLSR